MNCEGSAFLSTGNDRTTGSKTNMDEVVNVFDLSDDEASDCDQPDPSNFVLLALLTYTHEGWNITPAGRHVDEERFYQQFIPPAPTHVKIEIIEAKVIGSSTKDNTNNLNPYVKIKLEAQSKKKKKQSFTTKVQNKTAHPVFNESFEFAVDSPSETFIIQLLNHDGPLKMRHGTLGAMSFTVSDALSNVLEGQATVLSMYDSNRVKIAEVKILSTRLWK